MDFVRKMFKNVGKKLMMFAMISTVVEFVAAIIVGFIFLFIDDMGAGGAILILGSPIVFLIAVVSMWPLYAFGQITDDISAMRSNAGDAKSDELPEL